MISEEQNRTLTRVGKGTPMGELLRRYWHPVAVCSEFDGPFIKKLKILGEDLVLYRDKSGQLGLIDQRCPHRRASLEYGILECEGIRCAYHGWHFKENGQCMDQPNEPEDSTFKERIKIQSYPVKEVGGMFFTYMGPQPIPEFPMFDLFKGGNVIKTIGYSVVPVNWLQIMENSLDPVHVEWLHGHFYEQEKGENETPFAKHHVKIAFEEFEYGVVKKRLLEGQKEDESDDWLTGHPVIFPNLLLVGDTRLHQFQIRVPVDDTTTLHFWYNCVHPDENITIPENYPITHYEVPHKTADGKFIMDYVDGQDIMIWVSQGEINDRTEEHLGTTDRGIILFRKMLLKEISKMEKGEDPMCVFRKPMNQIKLPIEKNRHGLPPGAFLNHISTRDTRFSPNIEEIVSIVKGGSVKVQS